VSVIKLFLASVVIETDIIHEIKNQIFFCIGHHDSTPEIGVIVSIDYTNRYEKIIFFK
jgi:hypothetical protein